MKDKKSVVVIGGGTGTHAILHGLKDFTDSIDITAVISMTDSGGSTGRLRDGFGQLPVGDVRMALSALSKGDGVHEELLRQLFLYRFSKGEGLAGHNVGNLFLTALSEILGSEAEAVKAASKLLRIKGTVLPVTTDNVHLTAKYDDGVVIEGEHKIDSPSADREGKRIVSLTTNPPGKVNPDVVSVINSADLIVLGPGDVYSSILSNVVIDGMPEVLREASAKLVYVSNLMERFGQTTGMSVADCAKEIANYIGRPPEYILVNNSPLPEEIVTKYKTDEGVFPVVDDANTLEATVIRSDLLSEIKISEDTADSTRRSLIRHDGSKLAKAVMSLLE